MLAEYNNQRSTVPRVSSLLKRINKFTSDLNGHINSAVRGASKVTPLDASHAVLGIRDGWTQNKSLHLNGPLNKGCANPQIQYCPRSCGSLLLTSLTCFAVGTETALLQSERHQIIVIVGSGVLVSSTRQKRSGSHCAHHFSCATKKKTGWCV